MRERPSHPVKPAVRRTTLAVDVVVLSPQAETLAALLVRTAGGSVVARNAPAGSGPTYGGAWFHIELPSPNDTSAAREAVELPVSARASSPARD